MTTTTVETRINRKFHVNRWGEGDRDLRVTNTQSNEQVFSVLDKEQAEKLGLALLGENATVITDLPEAHQDSWGDYEAAGYSRGSGATRATILKNAKALLAIHALMVKDDAEKEAQEAAKAKAEEEAKAAEAKAAKRAEEARNWRRDQLAKEFSEYYNYKALGNISQQAIDRIIALETATA